MKAKVTFAVLIAFDIACSILNLLSIMEENKTKILIPILILKSALNACIMLFMSVNREFSYLSPKMQPVPVEHYFQISVVHQVIKLASGRD